MSSIHSVAQPSRRSQTAALLLVLALFTLACRIEVPKFKPDEPEPPATSDELLSFQVPVSVLTLGPGESIPNTQLVYQGHEDNVYSLLIDNQLAEKRIGDSVRWQGSIAPGVNVNYNLRVAPSILQEDLLLGGSVEVEVFSPVPVETESGLIGAERNVHFGNIFIDYRVPFYEYIPGTTIFFEGVDGDEAMLSGTSGYPYRAVGDSITWRGQIRDNVAVEYSLRVVSANEDELRVLGTASLWIDPYL